MSTEIEKMNVLFEEAQNNFAPPITIQLDITKMQNLFQGMCKHMMRMQQEIDGLKSQLDTKANQSDFSNFAFQINGKVDDVIEKNNESINQINTNMENLKNALLSGLEKCQPDAMDAARDLVAEVKPIESKGDIIKSEPTRLETSNGLPCQFIQKPVPTSDLEELTRQLQALSERVLDIESKRDIPSSGDLREKMNELEKKTKEITSSNSSSIHSPSIGQRLKTPDQQMSNHLYDLNEAIRTINDRLLQIENGKNQPEKTQPKETQPEEIQPEKSQPEKSQPEKTQLEKSQPEKIQSNQIISQKVPDEIYQQLKEHSEQIQNLFDELNVAKKNHLPPPPSQIELPPDNREAISQLNDRLYEIENNFSKVQNVTSILNDQVREQKAQIGKYGKQIEDLKDEIKSANENRQANNENNADANAEDKADAEENANDGENNNIPFDDDEQADESDNSMDTPRIKSSAPVYNDSQRSAPANLNTDELLESFLDAARAEVDKARKSIMEELSMSVRNATTQISGSVTKMQTTLDVGLKKANTRITDECGQIQSDLKNHIFEQQNSLKTLHVADAEIQEKIRLIEQRMETVMKIAKAPPPKMETLIDSKGKLDLAPLLTQIQAHAALCEDLSNRVVSLEERDYVSPASFNSALETIVAHEGQISKVECFSDQIDGQFKEIKEKLDDLEKKRVSHEDDAMFSELQETSKSVDAETKRLCEAMAKFNKDLISTRAAINTLRSHSEETSGSVEDVMKMCEQAKEETAATDKKLKKFIAYVQDQNLDLTNQIKDISRSVERNADRIEEIANRKSESSTLKTILDEEEEEEEEEDSSEKSHSSKKQKRKPSQSTTEHTSSRVAAPTKSPDVKYENVMTSPHVILPPLDEKRDSNGEELLIPKIPPQVLQKHQQQQQQQQVIQLPPQVVYEQPIVTVVRKQVEVETGLRNSAKMPLPRLAKAPGQQIRSQSEVSKSDLRKYDELFGRLDQLDQKFATTNKAVDVLNKQVKVISDTKAEKEALQALFDQFRLAMGELNNRIGSLRKNIIQKADIAELVQVRSDILREIKIQGETAAGTEPVRCLLCGNPRHGIAGAFDGPSANNALNTNPMNMKQNGPSISSRVSGADGSVCYVYGENGQMYLGRSQDGKPIVLRNLMNDPGNEGNGEPIQGTVPVPGAQ